MFSNQFQCQGIFFDAISHICVVMVYLKLALVQVDHMRIAVGEQTLCTPFTTDTTFLVASKDTRDTVSMLIAGARDGYH